MVKRFILGLFSVLGLLFVFLGLTINPAFAYKTGYCHGYGKKWV
ncbi:hypothetical protein Q7L89_05365 (plasmid) [Candidatus Liberibacter asiaticus]